MIMPPSSGPRVRGGGLGNEAICVRPQNNDFL